MLRHLKGIAGCPRHGIPREAMVANPIGSLAAGQIVLGHLG